MLEITSDGPYMMDRTGKMVKMAKRPELKRGTVCIYHYYACNTRNYILTDDATGRLVLTDYVSYSDDEIKESVMNNNSEWTPSAYTTLDEYARHIDNQFGIGIYYTNDIATEAEIEQAERTAALLEKFQNEKKETERIERENYTKELQHKWGAVLTPIKECKTTKDATDNVRKWLKAEYPGIKFRVKTGRCSDLTITEIDGKPLNDIANDIEFTWRYGRFDGMQDMYVYSNKVFNNLYGGFEYVDVEREFSPDVNNRIRTEIDDKFSKYFVDNKSIQKELAYENGLFQEIRDYFFAGVDENEVHFSLSYWIDMGYLYRLAERYINIPAETPKDPKKAAKIDASGLELVDYSEKAIAVIGDTKPIADKLKKMGGKFNPRLKCGAGWIFSKKKEGDLREALSL